VYEVLLQDFLTQSAPPGDRHARNRRSAAVNEPEPQEQKTRHELAQDEEAFFNQSGTVGGEFGETDTSSENSAVDRQPERGKDTGEIHPS
jgi:hypothetical protein